MLDSPEQSHFVNNAQANAVVATLARQLPLEEVWQWANSLPENLSKNAALAAAAEATIHDFTTASITLQALPPSELKNEALSRLAVTIGEGDPAQAFAILKELPPTSGNTRRMERILKDWGEIDAVSASAAADTYKNQ
ncbi:MAG: hypothetical protein ACI9R3_000550 [Verrucomicrobiales bacterium]